MGALPWIQAVPAAVVVPAAQLAGRPAGPRLPLDEALAWANLSFLWLFLAAIGVAFFVGRRRFERRDLGLYAWLGLLVITLLSEYHVRRTAYARENVAAQTLERTEGSAMEARALGAVFEGWDPVQKAVDELKRVRAEAAADLLGTQSVTTVLFTACAAGIGWLLVDRRRRTGRWLKLLLGLTVPLAAACAVPIWRAWGRGELRAGEPDGPSALAVSLISVGPGLALSALGVALLLEYRRLAHLPGVILSLGVVLYGALQLSEIGERLPDPGGAEREYYRFTLLSLALALRLALLATVAPLPWIRGTRSRIERWMASTPGGAVLASLRSDRTLMIREPDAVTARLPLSRSDRDGVHRLDLRALEGEWGTRVTRPGDGGSVEYLASPPDGLALYRVLLIPLPARFLGGDHLLLTFEAESVVRLLPRAHLGLALLRARTTEEPAADMRVWWCNDSVADLFGGSPAELLRRPLAELVHADWLPRLADVHRDEYSSVLIASSGGAADSPAEFIRMTACPFGEAAHGGPPEMLLVMLSSLSSDSHTHTDFLLHNLAHTLRTPIQLVRGALDRAVGDLDGSAPPDALERLSRARAESARLEHAVDLNLQVGRDLIGRGERPETFLLSEFVRSDVLGAYATLTPKELAPVVRCSRAKLRAWRETAGAYWSFDAESEAATVAHRAPLKVMLRELIDNALHYGAEESPPRVRVHAEDGRLSVTVENQLDAAELARHRDGLKRESQGLSCVRFLAVRYGYVFRIAVDPERAMCTARVTLRAGAAHEAENPEGHAGAMPGKEERQ